MIMSPGPIDEYPETNNWLRFMLDYRNQLFNFAIILNGALFTVVSIFLGNVNIIGLLVLCTFAIVINVLFFFAERRTMEPSAGISRSGLI